MKNKSLTLEEYELLKNTRSISQSDLYTKKESKMPFLLQNCGAPTFETGGKSNSDDHEGHARLFVVFSLQNDISSQIKQ
jgi:hypothetical protein